MAVSRREARLAEVASSVTDYEESVDQVRRQAAQNSQVWLVNSANLLCFRSAVNGRLPDRLSRISTAG
jgi:hypothetical protein